MNARNILIFLLAVVILFLLIRSNADIFQTNEPTLDEIIEKAPRETYVPENDLATDPITPISLKPHPDAKSLGLGLLHGITYKRGMDNSVTFDLISALKPRFWRFGNEHNDVATFINDGNFIENSGTKPMFVIQGAFHVRYGYDVRIDKACKKDATNCFTTYEDLKASWIMVTRAVTEAIKDSQQPVRYFEVFGEPINVPPGEEDAGTGITGISYKELADLFVATHNEIRKVLPDAKIGGPGWISFVPKVVEGFLDLIEHENVRIDFVSWHEFEEPGALLAHVEEIRRIFTERPKVCTPSCPEIIISEYQGWRSHFIPGEIVHWLYYLELAKVDQAHRACWDFKEQNIETCWSQFNGLLDRDNTTPLGGYWTYYVYNMLTNERIQNVMANDLIILGSVDTKNNTANILAGRTGSYGNNKNISIEVEDLPFTTQTIAAELWKIPTNNNRSVPLSHPIIFDPISLTVHKGKVTIPLQDMGHGDVYFIRLFQFQ